MLQLRNCANVKFVAYAKVGFVSLGCPKNLVDSEWMMGFLRAEATNLRRARTKRSAGGKHLQFIEAAQKESVDAILEMAEHKNLGRQRKLIVAGCLVSNGFERKFSSKYPEGTPLWAPANRALWKAVEGELRVLPAQPPGFYHDFDAAHCHHAEACGLHQNRRRLRSSLPRFALPSSRKVSSAVFESVVREAENLARGERGNTLIGQDTTSYGEDLGLRDGLVATAGKARASGRPSLGAIPVCVHQSRDAEMLDTLAGIQSLRKRTCRCSHASRNVLARMKPRFERRCVP